MTDATEAMSPPSIRGGNILHGKYRLERELGRGAMGTVWSAIHLSLDQRVAIKVISSDYANSAEAIHRFHTEAKAAAKLRSRYVVQVYDDGETPEGLPYIVMEYLEGESLEDRIVRSGDIPLAEAVRIATHVGRALARAHSRGIVHRDLKPANIFITRNDDDEMGWVAKVLDFGIAKVDDNREKSTTKTGTVLGTPLFMSAEQVRGASSVDARTDLYSLGMVFFNMLTGKYAFEGSSFGDLLVSICTNPLPKLSQHAPWVSQSLDNWFQKACAREVDARFQSADEMIDELYAAANLSFDGRMSFSDENSSLNQVLAMGEPRGLAASTAQRAGGTGNEARVAYATAATQNARALETSTGAASVHTIPGVPERKQWIVPAAVAGGLLAVMTVGVGWYVSRDAPLPAAADPRPVSAAAEPGKRIDAAAIEPAPAVTPSIAKAAAPAEPAAEKAEPPADPVAEPDDPSASTSATPAAAKPAPPRPRAAPRPGGPLPSKVKAKPSGDIDVGF
ncbi:MAG TPA: protein kinase [Polyangiaceae bacterium]